MVFQKHIQRRTSGHRDMHDLTGELQQIVEQSGIQRGIACLCNVGSTAASAPSSSNRAWKRIYLSCSTV